MKEVLETLVSVQRRCFPEDFEDDLSPPPKVTLPTGPLTTDTTATPNTSTEPPATPVPTSLGKSTKKDSDSDDDSDDDSELSATIHIDCDTPGEEDRKKLRVLSLPVP